MARVKKRESQFRLDVISDLIFIKLGSNKIKNVALLILNSFLFTFHEKTSQTMCKIEEYL